MPSQQAYPHGADGERSAGLPAVDQMTIKKTDIIMDIIAARPDAIDIFAALGMHCFECPIALGETLEEACIAHGADVDEILEELNKDLPGQA